MACLNESSMYGELFNAVCQSIACSLSPRHSQLRCRQQKFLQSRTTYTLEP